MIHFDSYELINSRIVSIYSQPLNSQLLDAAEHANNSACAQVGRRRSSRRKAADPIINPAQKFDRASTRARGTLVERFNTTSARLNPAPGVDSSAIPRDDMVLLMRTESMDRSGAELAVHTSSDSDRFNNLLGELMDNNPQFRTAIEVWAQSRGLGLAPLHPQADQQPLPPLPAPAAAAAASASTSPSSSTSDGASDSSPSATTLGTNVSESIDMQTLFSMAGLA